jgi:hypothetical protein
MPKTRRQDFGLSRLDRDRQQWWPRKPTALARISDIRIWQKVFSVNQETINTESCERKVVAIALIQPLFADHSPIYATFSMPHAPLAVNHIQGRLRANTHRTFYRKGIIQC